MVKQDRKGQNTVTGHKFVSVQKQRTKHTFGGKLVVGARYVGNTIKEAVAHSTVSSTIDRGTGKVVARDGKRLVYKKK